MRTEVYRVRICVRQRAISGLVVAVVAAMVVTVMVGSCSPAASTSPLPSPTVQSDSVSPTIGLMLASPTAVEPKVSISAPTSVAVVPSPVPSPSLAVNAATIVEHPLAELSPQAQTFFDGREGKVGVAVLVPNRQTIYVSNGDQLMSMASVVKVTVMLTTMDQAIKQNRDVTERERELFRLMITQSDNAATTTLWDQIGGGDAVKEYLRSIGITEIEPNATDSWGASRASAKAVATLFGKIAFGDILTPTMRKMAIDYLNDVVPSQRWGVTAGVPETVPEGTIIGLKDGWYPAGYGWWVNSAGMLIPSDSHTPYTIAILTRGQPTWEYGIQTIEGIAGPVHSAIHGQ